MSSQRAGGRARLDSMNAPVPTISDASLAALAFLGDGTRLQVLRVLAEGEITGSELAVRLDLPQSLASHHLRRLHDQGLVHRERRHPRVVYALDPVAWVAFTAPVRELCDLVGAVEELATDH